MNKVLISIMIALVLIYISNFLINVKEGMRRSKEERKEARTEKHDEKTAAKEDKKKARTEKHDEKTAAKEDKKKARTEKHEAKKEARTEKHEAKKEARTEKHEAKKEARTEKHEAKKEARKEKHEAKKEARTEKHEAKKEARTEKPIKRDSNVYATSEDQDVLSDQLCTQISKNQFTNDEIDVANLNKVIEELKREDKINNANKDTILKYIQHIRVLKLRINNEILYKTKFSDVFNFGDDDGTDQDIVSVLSNVDSAIKKKTDVINQLNILEKSLIDHYNYHKRLLGNQ